MLIKLIVRNYALIEELQIKYQPGLNIVTGETGAGKSILLGALSLILGQRADTSVLNNEHDKCIVEGLFNIEGLDLKDFFLVNDLDYDKQTLIRREISPAGKSRAFINDTPVNLILLKELGEKLIDIHSQHENLNLGSHAFQLKVIDNFTGNSQLLKEYQLAYHDFKNVEHEFESLKSEAEKNKQDLDYYSFQLNELEEARLMEDEDIDLQQEQEILSNAGDIKLNLANASQFLYNDDDGGVHRLKEALDHLGKAKNHFKDCEELASRLESAYIEVKDIAREVDVLAEKVEVDPARLDFVNQRLDLLFTLQQKHGVVNSNELIKKRDELDNMVNNIANSGLRLEELEKKMSETKQIASKLALQLHNARENAVPDLVETIQAMLQHLGMPNARFHVGITELGEMNENGLDRVDFLFSANKQGNPQEISKVASGGELSRLMLAVKSLLTSSIDLPTIIFDEIDAGVSGEIADKMGRIILDMASKMQVINITHLPQVAAKGNAHFLVYKEDATDKTLTRMRKLSDEDRVVEIAKMLSGADVTPAALDNARELLKV